MPSARTRIVRRDVAACTFSSLDSERRDERHRTSHTSKRTSRCPTTIKFHSATRTKGLHIAQPPHSDVDLVASILDTRAALGYSRFEVHTELHLSPYRRVKSFCQILRHYERINNRLYQSNEGRDFSRRNSRRSDGQKASILPRVTLFSSLVSRPIPDGKSSLPTNGGTLQIIDSLRTANRGIAYRKIPIYVRVSR